MIHLLPVIFFITIDTDGYSLKYPWAVQINGNGCGCIEKDYRLLGA